MWYRELLCSIGFHIGRKWVKTSEANLVMYEGGLPRGKRFYYEATCSQCGHIKHKKVDLE
jgi:hypothetical protein